MTAAPGTQDQSHAAGMGYTLLAALGFAAVSTLTTIAIRNGAALPNVLAWRYVLASVVLTVFVGVRGYPRMPGRDLTKWLIIGGGGQALFVGLALSSLAYIPVATLAFLFYTYPSWVTLVQAVRGAERVTVRRAVALALSFAGIVVIAGLPLGTASAAAASATATPAPDAMYWRGVAFALGAAVLYGVYIPTMQALQKSHPIPVTSALAKIGASACFLAWASYTGAFEWSLTSVAWSAIAALTIFSTVLPSLFFLMGLMRLGPVRTAIVSTVEPFLTAIIGALILGQSLTLRTLLGGAMIAAAVVLLQFRRERVA